MTLGQPPGDDPQPPDQDRETADQHRETADLDRETADLDRETADLDRQAAGVSPGPAVSWPLVAGTIAVGVLGAGWFLLSHLAMGTATTDALVEAIGAMLGLLVAVSVVGAVRSARVGRPGPPAE